MDSEISKAQGLSGQGRQRLLTVAVVLSAAWAIMLWLAQAPGLYQAPDYMRFYSLNAEWLGRHIGQGEIPWWNPHVGLGRPFFADLQAGALYPPNLLFTVLPIEAATGLVLWGHLAWAIYGSSRWARQLGANEWAAMAGGVLLVLLPAFMVRGLAGQVHYVAALCHAPGLFWLLTRWLQRGTAVGGLVPLAWLGCAQLLCGHPQPYWLTHVGLAIYAFGWLGMGGIRERIRMAVCLLVAMVMGLALAAPVLLPFLQLIQEGNRAGAEGGMSAFGALSWSDWAGMWAPPSDVRVPDLEGQIWVGWGLGALALRQAVSHFRSPGTRALIALGLGGFLLSTEWPEGIRYCLELGLPGYGVFRMPSRSAFLFTLATVMLAVVYFNKADLTRWKLRAGGLVLIFTMGSILWMQPSLRRWYVLPETFPYEPQVATIAARLRSEAGGAPPRIFVSPRFARENSGMLTGHSSFTGYVSLYLARPWAYVHKIAGLAEPMVINTFPDVRIYGMDPFLHRAVGFRAALGDMGALIALNPAPEPRVYVAYNARVISGWREALNLIAEGHNTRADVLLEAAFEGGVEGANKVAVAPEAKPSGSALITFFANERIEVRGHATHPGWLVLAEAWYPGWTATVNGEPAIVRPANGWMRTVAVPVGDFVVEWKYHERLFPAGAGVAMVAGLILVMTQRWSARRAVCRAGQVVDHGR